MFTKNKKIISMILIFIFMFLVVSPVNAIKDSFTIIGETEEENEWLNPTEDEYKNKSGTAIYDYENNILTLENYNGGSIYYAEEEPLTVVLKGENVITGFSEEVDAFSAFTDVTFTGDGTLLIKDALNGIVVNYGDLKLDNVDLTLNNMLLYGLIAVEGNITIDGGNIDAIDVYDTVVYAKYYDEHDKGNITINGNIRSDIEKNEEYTYVGLYADNTLTINGGDMVFNVQSCGIDSPNTVVNDGKISINPDIDYNPMAGISSSGTLVINGGDISSTGDFYALYAPDAVVINGGKILAKSYFSALMSEGTLNINAGYIELETPGEGHSVAMVVLNNNIDSLSLSDRMIITPEDLIKQKVEITQLGESIGEYAVTFGTDDITANVGIFIFDLTVTNAANSMTLYSKNKLTFNTNGGSTVADSEVIYGTKATKPTDPTKEGYEFKGWFTDEALENEYNFTETVTSDITLYAKWEEKQYTVTASVNDDTMGTATATPNKALKNTNITLEATAKEGYHFVEWQSEDVTVAENTFVLPAKDVTVKAVFAINKYTITFNTNGGSAITNAEVNYKGKITKPTDPTKEGYTFKGWFKDEALETEYDFDSEVTSNTTLYAKWEINKYTVTFNTNGGSAITNAEVNYKNKITKPTDPTKEGYVFKGWFKDEALETEYDFDSEVISDITLYAKWAEIISYTEDDSNGNSITFDEPEGHTFTFTITDITTSDITDKAVKLIKKSLISLYEIELKDEDNNEIHEGTFTIKIKLTEEMKKYHDYKLVYVNDDLEEVEDPISLTVEDGYLTGELPHLSKYALTGEPNKDSSNPKTADNIVKYLIAGLISLVGLVTLKIKKHN